LKFTGLELASRLWETWGMAYSPKVGDVVTADGQTGIFKVLSISTDGLAAIQPFRVSKQEVFGLVMGKIPRKCLRPFKEDSSQAALRVVREATEGE
jgi:hypothetical protein